MVALIGVSVVRLILCHFILTTGYCLKWNTQFRTIVALISFESIPIIPQISLYISHDSVNDLSNWLFDAEDFSAKHGKGVEFTVGNISSLKQNGLDAPKDIIDLFNDGDAKLLVGTLTIAQVRDLQKFIGAENSNAANTNSNKEIEDDDSETEEDKTVNNKGDANDKGVNDKEDEYRNDSGDEVSDGDGFNMNNIDGWKYNGNMMKEIKKAGRVTLRYGCAPSLTKELIFIGYTYKKRCAVGNTAQKGKWIHTNVLRGSSSTLRRKKPALKLISWDHEQYIKIEKDHKYSNDGYMIGDHAKEVKRETQKLIDGNKEPVNPSLWEIYVDVYGDGADRALMKEMKNPQ
eukprot:543678_1